MWVPARKGASAVNIMVDRGIKPAVTDPHDARLQQAVDIGAYDALAAPDAVFDVVFETSGTAQGLETALLRTEKFGRVALIGQTHGPVPVSTRPIVQKELTVQGSVIYNHPADFSQSVSELHMGRFAPAVGLREPVGPFGLSKISCADTRWKDVDLVHRLGAVVLLRSCWYERVFASAEDPPTCQHRT